MPLKIFKAMIKYSYKTRCHNDSSWMVGVRNYIKYNDEYKNYEEKLRRFFDGSTQGY